MMKNIEESNLIQMMVYLQRKRLELHKTLELHNSAMVTVFHEDNKYYP